jgi:hypothetical protein
MDVDCDLPGDNCGDDGGVSGIDGGWNGCPLVNISVSKHRLCCTVQLGYTANGTEWVAASLVPFIHLANFTLHMWENATVNATPLGDVAHGLIWGSPEHDTCRCDFVRVQLACVGSICFICAASCFCLRQRAAILLPQLSMDFSWPYCRWTFSERHRLALVHCFRHCTDERWERPRCRRIRFPVSFCRP